MTNAQAQAVVHDLVQAGYNVQAVVDPGGNWTVIASSSSNPVSCATAAQFATNHGVTGTTQQASFS